MIKLDSVSEQKEQGLKPCPFCELLNTVKRKNKEQNISSKYGAALAEETHYNSDYVAGILYRSCELNLCPVCGKKLKEG